MRTPTRWCVTHPVATLMISLGALIAGGLAGASMGIDLLPALVFPRLVVSASCPGLPASETRVLLTIPLEDALSSVKGVKRTSSVSRAGVSAITLEFHWGTDMQEAAVAARETIDAVSPSLPSDASRPVVLAVDPTEKPVMVIGVFPRQGDLAFARRAAERAIRSRLQQVAGVGSVTITGGVRDEVRVEVDQARMAARGFTLEGIAGSLASTLFEYPAGVVREGGAEYLVKAVGPDRAVGEIGNCRLRAGQDGPLVRLGDMAEVALATTEPSSLFQLDGRGGVGLLVRRQAGASPVSVSAGVTAALEELRRSWGRDLDLTVARDSSQPIVSSLGDLASSAGLGAVIAFAVLLLAVRNLATAGLLVSSVPVSILLSLLLLKLGGRTLNVMSLGGFALGIGMMIDNSVVILENLQRRLLGEGRGVTAGTVADAADELAGANIGSTVTSVVVFLPVILLPGILGALFLDLSLAVIFSQLSSFLVSITLMPVLFLLAAGRGQRGMGIPRSGERAPGAGQGGGPGFRGVERAFRALLRGSLRRPGLLAAVLIVVTLVGVACLRRLPFEFLPSVDSGELSVTLSLAHGTTIERAGLVAREASARIGAVAGVASVYARAGGEPDDPWYQSDPWDRPGIVHLTAVLAPGRRPSAFAIAPRLRESLAAVGAEASVELPAPMLAPILGMQSQATTLLVAGADQAEARARALRVREELSAAVVGAVVAVAPTGEEPELHLVPDREAMSRAGLSALDLASSARAALEGLVAARIPVEGRDTDVRVLLRKRDVTGPGDLGGLLVRSSDGAWLRLGELAWIERVAAAPALLRQDRGDMVKVSAEPAAAAGVAPARPIQAGVAPAGGEALATAVRELGVRFPFVTSEESMVWGENRLALIATFLLVVALLYLALGAQFESFGLPVLFLVTLPLGFSGIVAALAAAGSSLNLDSMLGVIVLFGVAVNNAIILSETSRQRLASGSTPLAAVYRGASDRLRPILITAATTVLALAPVAVDPGRTSTQSSMALAIIGGLAVSTPLSLFVVPRLLLAVLRRKAGKAGNAAEGERPELKRPEPERSPGKTPEATVGGPPHA